MPTHSRCFSVRFHVGPRDSVPDTWAPPDPDQATFGTGQLECNLGGHIFLNAYVEFAKAVRPSQLKSWLTRDTPGAHASSSPAQIVPSLLSERESNIAHATNADERYQMDPDVLIKPGAWVMGSKKRGEKQGERSDMHEIAEIMRTEGHDGLRTVATRFPGQFARYHGGIQLFAEVLQEHRRDNTFVPRPWQAAMIDVVKGGVNPRHIWWCVAAEEGNWPSNCPFRRPPKKARHLTARHSTANHPACPPTNRSNRHPLCPRRIYDASGNNGKSRLALNLISEHKAIQLSGDKRDMAFAFNRQRVVLFDIPRGQSLISCKEMFYFAEELKNGSFMSSKYASRHKLFDPPHVIFFSNEDAPKGVWSEDRLQVVKLGAPSAFEPFTHAAGQGQAAADKRLGVKVEVAGNDDEKKGSALFLASYTQHLRALETRLSHEDYAERLAQQAAAAAAVAVAAEPEPVAPDDDDMHAGYAAFAEAEAGGMEGADGDDGATTETESEEDYEEEMRLLAQETFVC